MAYLRDAIALEAELGTGAPPGLIEALSPEDLQALANSMAAAKQRQSTALDGALKDALRHVPFGLRGMAEAILL